MTKIIFTLIILFITIGCAPPVEKIKENITSYDLVFQEGEIIVYRIYDHEKDVTCWILDNYNGGGISCIPNKELVND